MARNQRERILAAVPEALASHGYGGATVESIISIAGVSRKTFYDHFANKEEAFLAAYDAAVAQLRELIEEAFAGASSFPTAVQACVEALAETLANEPAFAAMCIVEVLAAGPAALERRNQAMLWFATLIERAAGAATQASPDSSLAAETIVGGLYEVIYARVLSGQTHQLTELVPDLVYCALLPYLGEEAARAASQPRRSS